jgi:hypothetical protein
MREGFQMKQEYNEMLHLETLRLLRMGAYTTYISIPQKKGTRKVKIENFYPLPKDKKKVDISRDEIEQFFSKYDSYITNGKLRGYRDMDNNLWNNDKTKIIGHIINDEIKYIN